MVEGGGMKEVEFEHRGGALHLLGSSGVPATEVI